MPLGFGNFRLKQVFTSSTKKKPQPHTAPMKTANQIFKVGVSDPVIVHGLGGAWEQRGQPSTTVAIVDQYSSIRHRHQDQSMVVGLHINGARLVMISGEGLSNLTVARNSRNFRLFLAITLHKFPQRWYLNQALSFLNRSLSFDVGMQHNHWHRIYKEGTGLNL